MVYWRVWRYVIYESTWRSRYSRWSSWLFPTNFVVSSCQLDHKTILLASTRKIVQSSPWSYRSNQVYKNKQNIWSSSWHYSLINCVNRNIVAAFGSHLNIDLQQRAVEFGVLCRSYDHLRGPILERMPPIPSDRLNKRSAVNGDIGGTDQNNSEELLLGDLSPDHTNVNDHGDSVCTADCLTTTINLIFNLDRVIL